jgi:signal transduction histidine kinase
MRLKLFGKIFLSLLLVIIVWMVIFSITARVILVPAFTRQYNRFVQNPSAEMVDEIRQRLGRNEEGQQPFAGQVLGGRLRTEIIELFRRVMNVSLGISMLISLAAAVLASYLIATRLSKPVQQMSLAAERIAEGNYAERVDLPGDLEPDYYDEWQDFAYQFNQMASSLEETENRRQQLLGDVAHEMRTPLTTIKGYMEALMDGVVPADEQTYYRVHQEADRLEHLVKDLQELSRVSANADPLKLEPLAPAALINGAFERLRFSFEEKSIAVLRDIDDKLPPVKADRLRIEQVLINLLGNALHYTPQDGQVRLTARRHGGEVQFSVIDSGIGIAPDQLPLIFNRFYRVDKSRARASGGSGIGLTIAKHLVEAHGGRIWVESQGEGQGTTFHFTLPVA